MKGLLGGIYKTKHCSGGEYSRNADEALLIGNGVPEIFDERRDLPTYELIVRYRNGGAYMFAIPIGTKHEGVGIYGFSGTFLYCCDSRWPSGMPIPIHDQKV